MKTRTLVMGAAAVAALGGLTVVSAQQPPVEPPAVIPAPVNPVPVPRPQVVQWPGGYVVVNDPEVVVRQQTPGRSTNVVVGSGNGFGNTIVVDGGPGGTTIVRNSRNGFGNRLVIDPDDLLIEIPELADVFPWCVPKPAPANPVVPPKIPPADPVLNPPGVPVAPALPAPVVSYKGKNTAFWSKRVFSEAHDCNLYWSDADKRWFRYHPEDDTYRPVLNGPETPVTP